MGTIAIWLDGECSEKDQATFHGVALRVALKEPMTRIAGVHSGEELVALAYELEDMSIDHLVIAAHGGPTWILDEQYGITTGRAMHAGQVSVSQFARTWAPKLTTTPLISLAACMCSRAPRWFLLKKFGYLGSDWGARGYLPGGEASLSARIRDYLIWYHVYPEVRGHRTSGHTTYNPILAVHDGYAGRLCRSWWSIENPGAEPSLAARRRWVRERQGQPAEDWLMGWTPPGSDLGGYRGSAR